MFSHLILEHKHETLSRVLLARKNSSLGQIPKFYPLMYILQTRWQMLLGKKKFLGFHFPIAHWKGHVLQTKLYKTIIPSGFIDVLQVIEIRAFTWFFAKGNKKIK